jgi:hypothetical protein
MTLTQLLYVALFLGDPGIEDAIGASQMRQVSEEPIIIDYVPPPATLEEAIARAHVVVRARIAGAESPKRGEGSSPAFDVRTAYKLDIVEVLKSDAGMAPPVEVVRYGGDLQTEKGARRVVEEDFPAFGQGNEYLVFLFWNDYLKVYEPAFGPDAAFQVAGDGRLQAIGRSMLSQQQAHKSTRDVRSRIREIAAAGRAR